MKSWLYANDSMQLRNTETRGHAKSISECKNEGKATVEKITIYQHVIFTKMRQQSGNNEKRIWGKKERRKRDRLGHTYTHTERDRQRESLSVNEKSRPQQTHQV